MPWTDICQNVRWRKILIVYLGILDFDTGSCATKKDITFPKVDLLNFVVNIDFKLVVHLVQPGV